MDVLQGVLAVNGRQTEQVFRLLGKHFPSLAGKRVSVLGLSFRPDTNDMRESPAIPIVRRLLAEGAAVSAYDPAATAEARRILGDGVNYCASLGQVLDDAEAVVLVTRWKEFERVPQLLARDGRSPVFVDGRRMLDKKSVERYEGIGL
jgi:UDPglucose 6-dehydrogenase/GDP-mannose 6-dehydrogenase